VTRFPFAPPQPIHPPENDAGYRRSWSMRDAWRGCCPLVSAPCGRGTPPASCPRPSASAGAWSGRLLKSAPGFVRARLTVKRGPRCVRPGNETTKKRAGPLVTGPAEQKVLAMSTLFDSEQIRNAEGEGRRDKALSILRARRANLIRECTAAALRIALDRGEVCADDVRALVAIPPDISPKLVGVVFRDLADACILRRAGFRNSTRPAAHARPLSIWRLADAAAALAWLASHPPLTAD